MSPWTSHFFNTFPILIKVVLTLHFLRFLFLQTMFLLLKNPSLFLCINEKSICPRLNMTLHNHLLVAQIPLPLNLNFLLLFEKVSVLVPTILLINLCLITLSLLIVASWLFLTTLIFLLFHHCVSPFFPLFAFHFHSSMLDYGVWITGSMTLSLLNPSLNHQNPNNPVVLSPKDYECLNLPFGLLLDEGSRQKTYHWSYIKKHLTVDHLQSW